MTTRTSLRTLGVLTTLLACTACGVTVEHLPLPDAAPGGPTYTVHAVFDNALNLPDGARVKLGGSDIGVVTDIRAAQFEAVIAMSIRDDVALPVGSTAELRQATPLGEVHVALAPPATPGGTGLLGDGDTITLASTSAGATVEELLISVSLVVNGGGAADLSRIGGQLGSIVNGHGGNLAHLLTELTGIVTELSANSAKIDAVLTEFDTLTATFEASTDELGRVADTLPHAMGALAENNAAIGTLLDEVATASAALGDYASTTGPALVGLLDSVTVLTETLAASGDRFGYVMDQLQEFTDVAGLSIRGKSLATYMTLSSLELGTLRDHETSRSPNSQDLADFVGSFLQVLLVVQGRMGEHR